MGDLVGLPGVKGGRIENVRFAQSVSGAMRVLRTGRAVTGAGDDGAWTVYRDDEGCLRCVFHRRHMQLNEATYTKKKNVEAWLREWMPRVQR